MRAALVPIRRANAKTIAMAFFSNIIATYGTPIQIISGNGCQFVSGVFRDHCHKLNISHLITVSYRLSKQPGRTNQSNSDADDCKIRRQNP